MKAKTSKVLVFRTSAASVARMLLTDDHRAFRESVRQFVDTAINPACR